MSKSTDFRYNTGATKVPWPAVGENYNAQDLMEVIRFLMKGEGPEYEKAIADIVAVDRVIAAGRSCRGCL